MRRDPLSLPSALLVTVVRQVAAAVSEECWCQRASLEVPKLAAAGAAAWQVAQLEVLRLAAAAARQVAIGRRRGQSGRGYKAHGYVGRRRRRVLRDVERTVPPRARLRCRSPCATRP